MIKSKGNSHYIIRPRLIIPALRGQALNIATALAIIALIAVVAMISWLSMTSPAALDIQRQQQEYFKALEHEQNDPVSMRAWKRLHRKHGYPGAVIYEPGKTPWYTNKQGQKCKFI
jgi:hypothetical protein